MKLEKLLPIARELVEAMRPACVQIEIAGGIRRGKAEPHDIEIVAQPARAPLVTNFFGEVLEDFSLLDERLAEMVEAGVLEPGRLNGPRQKQFKVPRAGAILDLFVVTPPAQQFGYVYAIRTGPAHYSKWLVTRRQHGGALPSDLQARDGAVWRNGQVVEMPTEEAFYAVLGIPMPAPADRVPMWGRVMEEAL